MKASNPPKPPSNTPEFFSPQVSAARRFYLNLSPPPRTALAVVSGGCEHCTPDYQIHRATFPFYSIEYVVRGQGSLKLGNREHHLQPGTVFSYGPGVRQDMAADAGDPPVKYFLDFAGSRAGEILRTGQLPSGSVARVFPPNEMENLFNELIECGQRNSSQPGELCVKLLECLVLKLAGARAPASGAGTLAFTTYQTSRTYIEKNFQRLKTLQQIAAECHLDAAYLCRLFQKFDHQSPYQFLMRLKMNFAAGQLQAPDALVKQIAEKAGFSDPFHFSRAFKSVIGLSPDQFRRMR